MNKTAFNQAQLAEEFGIIFMPGLDAKGSLDLKYMERRIAADGALGAIALDAQPELVTAANAGILSLFTTYVDPNNIEILVAPTKAAELYGETKKGTWVSDTAMFITIERTGEVSSYGDFSQDGTAGANANFPQRQSYLFQASKFTRRRRHSPEVFKGLPK